MDYFGVFLAVVGIMLALAMFLCLGDDLWCIVEDYDAHAAREFAEKVEAIKHRVEVADFMKANGVITEEAYQKEMAEVNAELDKLEEEYGVKG